MALLATTSSIYELVTCLRKICYAKEVKVLTVWQKRTEDRLKDLPPVDLFTNGLPMSRMTSEIREGEVSASGYIKGAM